MTPPPSRRALARQGAVVVVNVVAVCGPGASTRATWTSKVATVEHTAKAVTCSSAALTPVEP
jgi:hypothetical protein